MPDDPQHRDQFGNVLEVDPARRPYRIRQRIEAERKAEEQRRRREQEGVTDGH